MGGAVTKETAIQCWKALAARERWYRVRKKPVPPAVADALREVGAILNWFGWRGA